MSRDGSKPPAAHERSPLNLALTAVLLTGVLVVPLIVRQTGWDVFRIPKQAVYESVAAFAAALLGIIAIYCGVEPFHRFWREQRAPIAIAFAAVVWTAIATAASTNRTLSVLSLQWVTACAAVFLATLFIARRHTPILFVAPLIPAVVNALVAMLQRSDTWNPLTYDPTLPLRIRTSGFVGNPNDLGAYLLFPAICAIVAATVNRGLTRALFAVTAAVLIGGIIAAESLGGIGACTAAALTLMLLIVKRPKRAFAFAIAVAIVVTLGYAPLRTRAAQMFTFARSGRYLELSSFRTPAYLAAARMFASHPLTGVGPGCFGFWYLPYKLELNQDYPEFFSYSEMFGETHNDHLQTLAVSGLPGYLILLAALFVLGRESFRRRSDAPSFARRAALPLAVGFAVAALAQFPLELASTMSVMLHYAALVLAEPKP